MKKRASKCIGLSDFIKQYGADKLALKLKVSRAAAFHWANGTRFPNTKNLCAIWSLSCARIDMAQEIKRHQRKQK